MNNLQGQLLIASPRLSDPNFLRTVVLIVQDDDSGTMGLILNRPLDLPASDVLMQALDEPVDVAGSVHQGGPCEGPLMVLHTAGEFGQIDVGGGVFFTAERHDIEKLIAKPLGPMKFFANYAGWTRGQLESEIEEGGWLTHPSTPRQVFDPIKHQWSKMLLAIHSAGRLSPDEIPDDPTMN